MKKSVKVDNETRSILVYGLTLRFIMIIIGAWADASFKLDFTDIDYHIFTDAARYVSKGDSPFARNTYRYSPLLAYLLVPNVVMPAFGKILFSLADMFLVYALHVIFSHRREVHAWVLMGWSLNPLVASICTRGSFDSISNSLVLAILASCLRNNFALCGMLLGLVIHLRIYPIIYTPALLLYMSHPLPILSVSFYTKKWAYYVGIIKSRPMKNSWTFLCCVVGSFVTLTMYFYVVYGKEYLDASMLYHFRRIDIRHNFSPQFYAIYLTNGSIPMLSSVPQMLLIGVATLVIARHDLILSIYVISHIFVAFNKVSTAQYFTWFGCIVPLLLPRLHGVARLCFVGFLWMCCLASWLWNAYILEFQGENNFLAVWVCGMLFLVSNSLCIVYVIVTCKKS